MFKLELEKERKILGFKSPKKIVYATEHQTGKTNVKRDKARKALPPGKRISKTGKIYYEGRKNRSDLPGSKL